MLDIIRSDISEESALASIVEAGDTVFISFCVGNIGLTLESVVKIDAMFRDVWNIPVLEKVIRERFNGKYP